MCANCTEYTNSSHRYLSCSPLIPLRVQNEIAWHDYPLSVLYYQVSNLKIGCYKARVNLREIVSSPMDKPLQLWTKLTHYHVSRK